MTGLDFIANTDRQAQYELFDTGAFNAICKGYLILALEGIADAETIKRAVKAMNEMFEYTTAEQAESYYRKGKGA